MSDPCYSDRERLLTVDAALALLLQHATPIQDIEQVAIAEALGRVLARSITATVNVPPTDNSAMDGYAVRSGDINPTATRLEISQRIAAGQAPPPLLPGTAARIFTGAPIPSGADAIVMQENTRTDGNIVVLQGPIKPGQFIRRQGEDILAGSEILVPGIKLHPQHLGLAASVGIAHFAVYRRLRVTLFSTGDELVAPGQALAPGKIYNSNHHTLTGLLQTLGCEVRDGGSLADNRQTVENALTLARPDCDLILSSGGVSVGEEDHVRHAVEALGELQLWRIAVKPGKPLAFGRIGDTPFLGLPGNPVSVFVTFCLFARAYICARQGLANTEVAHWQVPAGFEWPKPGNRREYLRARLNEKGEVVIYPHQGSGVLTSTTWASGLVCINEGETVTRGQPVSFISFNELLA